ncbi:hypothetical protein FHETE_3017 [Fusarium heterosporum]|uniref:Uncharacterized protein n=1 Tax=Fusarium heterosporum TaxID=42747 RepID=A0A8H5TL28_FUSHE|nr:hypothetical protein FHETE_3017 [Fusarium heterosporum]
MAGVVENALLQLKPGYNAQKLHAILKKSQQIQAQWIREHQPKLLEGKPYDHTTDFWIYEHKSPYLFLTAPWESADAHKEWIKSQENTLLMQELMDFIEQDTDAVVLYHLCPAGKNEFRGDMLAKWPINVWNITVKPEEKEILEKEYRLIETNSSTEPGQRMWAGWRIEKGEAEELIIIASPSFEDVIESGIAVRMEEDRVSRFEYRPIFH